MNKVLIFIVRAGFKLGMAGAIICGLAMLIALAIDKYSDISLTFLLAMGISFGVGATCALISVIGSAPDEEQVYESKL